MVNRKVHSAGEWEWDTVMSGVDWIGLNWSGL